MGLEDVTEKLNASKEFTRRSITEGEFTRLKESLRDVVYQ